MPFHFAELCTLLSRLEDVETHQPPLLPKFKAPRYREVVERWFESHRRQLNELDAEGAAALLSALLPGWRSARVYGIQAPSLCRILGRALGMKLAELELYQQPGNGDLASCLERVLESRSSKAEPPVTVEDVDTMLQTLAGSCHWSDPSVPRLPPNSSEKRDQPIKRVLLRCSPNEGKWLVRLILKDLRPIQVDDNLLLRNFHFLLPDLLRFHRDFHAAVSMLKGELRELPARPEPRTEQGYRTAAAAKLRPAVGIKISRPHFHKARRFDCCLTMLGGRDYVIERKYDGEYCEIHLDLRTSPDPIKCIKIFSKSGKDSTLDRKDLLPILVNSLRLGQKDCKIRNQAILLGELIVYSDDERRARPFDDIRKHVARSGRYIGTGQDSLPKACEHLAIVFFDVLLLDEELVLNRPVDERRMWLREIYKKIQGQAIGAEWKKIDFSNAAGKRMLAEQFSAAIARRCEGLVLKPCGVPYFSLEMQPADYRCSYIKLKKDYINGLGDEEDMAVIGASFDAALAQTAPAKGYIKWTTFYLGCMINKDEVVQRQARPVFKHVGSIDHEKCLPRPILETANILGNLSAQPYIAGQPPKVFDIKSSTGLRMEVVFDRPLVFEILGSGYEKPSDCSYFMLRHARVKKLHQDRTWLDCVSFQQLQANAKAARELPALSESQETRIWLEKLERGCKTKFDKELLATPRPDAFSTPDRSALLPTPAMARRRDLSTPSKASKLPASRPSAEVVTTSSACLLPSPQAPLKRRHECGGPNAAGQMGAKRPCLSVGTQRTGAASSPLSEITNVATAEAQLGSTRTSRHLRASSGLTNSLISLVQPKSQSESQEQSQMRRAASRTHCEMSPRCPFKSAAVYLAPCIASTPYITDDLLDCHNSVTVSALDHWDRDSFAYTHVADTISESQSYAGLRKIVLVESWRRRQVQEIVRQVQALNGGHFRERIEVHDWRILEHCQEHVKGAGQLKMHFIGATLFDDTQQRALFVSEKDWISA